MASKPADVARILGWGQRSDSETVINAMATLIGTRSAPGRGADRLAHAGAGHLDRLQGLCAARRHRRRPSSSQYRQLPGVKVVMAETARHFIMYDEPDWMHAQIEQFLD